MVMNGRPSGQIRQLTNSRERLLFIGIDKEKDKTQQKRRWGKEVASKCYCNQGTIESPSDHLPVGIQLGKRTICSHLSLKMQCSCLEKGFKRFFRWLGTIIARYYIAFIIIPPILSLLLGTGCHLIYKSTVQDAEFLFSPVSGLAKEERAVVESHFPSNNTSNFDPARMTRLGRFARIFAVPRDDKTVLRKSIFEDLIKVDQLINTFTVTWEGKNYTYQDLCAKDKNGKCFENSILNYISKMESIESGHHFLKYPVITDLRTMKIDFLPTFLGGLEIDPEGRILFAKAAGLVYFLNIDTPIFNKISYLWEQEFLNIIGNTHPEHISLMMYVSDSLGDELHRNIMSVLKFFVLSVVFMICYSVTATSTSNWLLSKPWLGLIGCFTSLFGVISAYGFCLYIGQSWIAMNIAILFIMIGIGMDDTFVILAAWWRTDPRDSVEDRTAETFANSGIAITITSLTNFLSFFVGTFTPFPATYIFCAHASTAVAFTYLLQITFFGGVLVFCGKMEKENRHSLFYFCNVIHPEQAKEKGCIFQILCSGSGEHIPSEKNFFAIFFRDYVGGALSRLWVKILIIAVFLAYLGVGSYGCTTLREGLEVEKLFQHDSYAADYYDSQFTYFYDYYLRIQMVITEDIDYSNPKVQEKLELFTQKVENSSFIANGSLGLTESWMRILKTSYPIYNFRGYKMSNHSVFVDVVKNSFLSLPAHKRFENDIEFNENGTKILASRILFQTTSIKNTNDAKFLLIALRKLAEEAPFKVTFYNAYFPFMDHFIIIGSVTIDSVLITLLLMAVIAFFFIPSLVSIILMVLALISIQVGIIGYMALWNVPLDPISMICLIMCVGFSVDNCAHVLHAFRDSEEKDPNKKIQDSLYKVGLPIIQGCISSFIAILALILEGAFIFWTFFRIILLVLMFGALHSLFLLPILLYFAEKAMKKKNDEPELDDPAVRQPLSAKEEPQAPSSELIERISIV
ncbi:daf-6 [Cordylochernes scorpioides]|uniref:Daf-6 n=1 Tax=Cordylochernes scorpioides TaxID=51811 RepID=A0ABY6LHM2_9ARAC|nr:daf-6 [Cordylochernes scorpioides]